MKAEERSRRKKFETRSKGPRDTGDAKRDKEKIERESSGEGNKPHFT
jgi:hypothetical protein